MQINTDENIKKFRLVHVDVCDDYKPTSSWRLYQSLLVISKKSWKNKYFAVGWRDNSFLTIMLHYDLHSSSHYFEFGIK